MNKKTGFQIAAAVCVLIAGAAILLATDITLQDVLDAGRKYPAVFIAAFFVLPVISCPITPLFLGLGILFPSAVVSLSIAAVGIVFHLLVTYYVSNSWFRQWLLMLLAKRQAKLPDVPPDRMVFLTFVFFAVPGLPYAIKNVVWAMSNVPFRIYFWVAWPVYFVTGGMLILLGESALKQNWGLLAAVLVVAVIITILKSWLKKRVEERPELPT